MEVNGSRQLSGYQHSLKHLILCSKKGRLMQVWNTNFIFFSPGNIITVLGLGNN